MDKLKVVEDFISKEDADFFIDWIDKNYSDTSMFRHRIGVAFNKGLAVRAVFPDEKPATMFKEIEEAKACGIEIVIMALARLNSNSKTYAHSCA